MIPQILSPKLWCSAKFLYTLNLSCLGWWTSRSSHMGWSVGCAGRAGLYVAKSDWWCKHGDLSHYLDPDFSNFYSAHGSSPIFLLFCFSVKFFASCGGRLAIWNLILTKFNFLCWIDLWCSCLKLGLSDCRSGRSPLHLWIPRWLCDCS